MTTLTDVKKALGDRFDTVAGLSVWRDKHDVPYEPAKAKKMPGLSVMTTGFDRAGLETPAVAGQSRMQDPLGGRVWIYSFAVRVWVGLGGDAAAAETTMDDLLREVVIALEQDKSLGGIAVDAAMSHGDVGIVTKQTGQPMLMLTTDTAVEVEEATT